MTQDLDAVANPDESNWSPMVRHLFYVFVTIWVPIHGIIPRLINSMVLTSTTSNQLKMLNFPMKMNMAILINRHLMMIQLIQALPISLLKFLRQVFLSWPLIGCSWSIDLIGRECWQKNLRLCHFHQQLLPLQQRQRQLQCERHHLKWSKHQLKHQQ